LKTAFRESTGTWTVMFWHCRADDMAARLRAAVRLVKDVGTGFILAVVLLMLFIL